MRKYPQQISNGTHIQNKQNESRKWPGNWKTTNLYSRELAFNVFATHLHRIHNINKSTFMCRCGSPWCRKKSSQKQIGHSNLVGTVCLRVVNTQKVTNKKENKLINRSEKNDEK